MRHERGRFDGAQREGRGGTDLQRTHDDLPQRWLWLERVLGSLALQVQRIGLGGERRPLKRQLLLLRVDVSQSTGDDEQPLLEIAVAPPHITLPRGWAMLRLRTGVARYSSQPPGCLSPSAGAPPWRATGMLGDWRAFPGV